MNSGVLANVVTYSAQLAIVVSAAALLAWARPIRDVRRAHQVWQALLVAAIALPATALWPRAVPITSAAWLLPDVALGGGSMPARVDWARVTASLLAAGVLLRVTWLAIGLVSVRRYARRAVEIHVPDARAPLALAAVDSQVEVRLSHDVHAPATVGVVRPVVLLPPSWSALDDAMARAVLAHELIHVRRRDWLRVCVEELWCALLWFHPAARLLVAQVDTAREMVVDREVVATTGEWRSYARALLAFSEAQGRVPHPVASLIRPRHLDRRIRALSEEGHMTRHGWSHWSLAAGALAAITTATAWALPMPGPRPSSSAVPAVQDEVLEIGNGVTAPRVVREVKPQYTPAAMQAKIQGAVELSAVVRRDGTVGDVTVVKSLDAEHGLDDSAVAALQQWTFQPAEKGGQPVAVRVTVEMRFTLKE